MSSSQTSKQEIWQQTGNLESYSMGNTDLYVQTQQPQANTRNMLCYKFTKVCGCSKGTYYFTSVKASTESCLVDLLNHSFEMSGLQIHCWTLLELLCRQIYFLKPLWFPAYVVAEQAPREKGWWKEQSFSVVTQLERNFCIRQKLRRDDLPLPAAGHSVRAH